MDIEASIKRVIRGARSRREPPHVEVLVQHLELTDDRRAAAARFVAEGIEGLDVETALHTPFLLFGTPHEIAVQVRSWRNRLGISGYIVRTSVVAAAAEVIALLSAMD